MQPRGGYRDACCRKNGKRIQPAGVGGSVLFKANRCGVLLLLMYVQYTFNVLKYKKLKCGILNIPLRGVVSITLISKI